MSSGTPLTATGTPRSIAISTMAGWAAQVCGSLVRVNVSDGRQRPRVGRLAHRHRAAPEVLVDARRGVVRDASASA